MFTRNFQSIDVIYSGKCNMACSYCYIHKNKSRMEQYNSEIREALSTGAFAKNVINTLQEAKNDIRNISLWGAEPTLNADLFEPFIVELLNYFPKAKDIMFSTNALLGINAIKYFIDALDNYSMEHNRELQLFIQFSIDGPEWINDTSRHPGATNNTIKAIKDTLQYANNINEKFSIIVAGKPTVSTDWFKYITEHPEKTLEYYHFFDDLQDECLTLFNNKNITCSLAQTPTIVNPGEYTKEDGMIFAKWLSYIRTIDTTQFKYFDHPLYDQQYYRFLEFEKYSLPEQYLNGSYGCSAGNSSLSLDYKGDVMTCHKAYDNLYMGATKNELFCDNISSRSENLQKAISRLTYVNTLYHQAQKSRYYLFKYLIYGLVLVGELPESILNNQLYLKWLMHVIGNCICHIGQAEETGSIYILTMSYINFFAYGAAEELLKYYSDCVKAGIVCE